MVNIRNRGTMVVTNQERVREFRGKIVHVFGGGKLSAVNLEIHAINMTVDALATVEATLKGASFRNAGMCTASCCEYDCIEIFVWPQKLEVNSLDPLKMDE